MEEKMNNLSKEAQLRNNRPKKRKKRSARKIMIDKLDVIVSLIVRRRHPYCVTCGKKENLTCGHVFSRAHYATRWDLDNCFTQCMGCNLKHEYDPMPFYDWYQKEFGTEKFREVYNKWKEISHFKDHHLEEMYCQLVVVKKHQEESQFES